MNIHSSKFHHPEVILQLETLLNKLEAILLTETWLRENDPLTKLDFLGHQPIESKPKKRLKRRSGGVAFFFREGIEFYPIEFEKKVECSIFPTIFESKRIKIFCVTYRPQQFKVNQLSQFFVEVANLFLLLFWNH